MFETAELGQKVSKEEYDAQVPKLREELLEAQVKQFLEDIPGQLEEIRGALDHGDADTVWGKAHRLKGAAGNLSADQVAAAALHLERIGREGKMDEAPEAFTVLEDSVAQLKGFVSHLDWSVQGS